MSVSKNAAHSTGTAGPSPGPGQARGRTVSPLRQRMIGDMELAGLTRGTQQCYLGAVVALQRHTGTAPDQLTEKQVYQYVLWLRDEKGVAKGTFQTNWHGIKFVYYRTLGWTGPCSRERRCASPGASACRRPSPGMTGAD